MISISVLNGKNETLFEQRGDEQVTLVYEGAYQQGDKIRVEAGERNAFYWLQMDAAVGRSIVYMKGAAEYQIPFGDARANLSPLAFEGERHLVCARKCKPFEIAGPRNLAINPNDQAGIAAWFPHASANVETPEGGTNFAATNAIDGVIAPQGHWMWPFGSWGINRREDAAWRLDFGRKVAIDRLIVFLRADFPHDSWWTEGRVSFSDGSSMVLHFEKGGQAQEFTFAEKTVEWLVLDELKKADDGSPFPALTQLEAYGREAGV